MVMRNSSERLALLGGTPVRQESFLIEPMIDDEEEHFILRAIQKRNFSRYIGSGNPDIERQLRLPSREVANFSDDWHFLGGENVRKFGAEFSETFDVSCAIPINSATSGLSVALAAVGVGPGDEVIVPAMSFTATGTSVLLFNALPVFVDVDPRTFCIDPQCIEAAITSRTKAILPVHLLGNACDMDAIVRIADRYHLKIIEDCAQAPGTRYKGQYVGTIGDAGVFSFQQSKNIMTGEGGMIVTNDPEVARKARLILNHGEAIMDDSHREEELVNIVGCNMRMPELCAALGRAQLKKLHVINDQRNRNFSRLVEGLEGIPGLTPPFIPPDVHYICHIAAFLYDSEVIELPRDIFLAAVRAEGIPMGTGYTRLMYENPLFLRRIAYGSRSCPWTCPEKESQVEYRSGQCPVAENLINEKFLWLYHIAYPSTERDMDDVVSGIRKVIQFKRELRQHAEKIRESGAGKKQQGRIV
ncbi:MAG: hypothetical protein NPIRA02_16330 [Nitrospirales bacterium]|nr:MAG: hypothetical protein NPIRA02_16330 [Nitrospirales bacterium]